MKKRTIKLGLVGCGHFGPNLLRNFIRLPGVEVAVVCDQAQERLKRVKALYPFLKLTKDFRQLLKEEIEAVVVATPLSSHFSLTKQALAAGKHVLVEKPFVRSQNEAKQLIRLAKKKDLVLMVDHTLEYSAAVKEIKALVKRNELGKIYTIDMIRVNLGLFQQDYNVIWDLAYHDVSILLYILSQMPEKVIAVGNDFIQKGIEDSVYLILKFSGKTLASLHLSWLDPYKIRRITFVGSKKMLVFDDLEPTEKVKILDKGVAVKTKKLPKQAYYESFNELSYHYRQGDIFIPHLDQTEPLLIVAEHFIQCLRQGKKPQSGGKEGLGVIRVLEAAEQSLKAGGKEVKIKND